MTTQVEGRLTYENTHTQYSLVCVVVLVFGDWLYDDSQLSLLTS